jgi:hypothetical protein
MLAGKQGIMEEEHLELGHHAQTVLLVGVLLICVLEVLL